MERSVQKELLDQLPAEDPGAVRSRRDLHRLNAWMGHAGIVARVLRGEFSRYLSFQMIELGAGDGEFLLSVAERLRGQWRGVEAVLLDRQELWSDARRRRFAELRWQVRPIQGDAVEWLEQTGPKTKVIVANLFLHHLDNDRLRHLFRVAATKSDFFIAVEPWRARWPLFCSRLVRWIGCGAVTRHDAPVSVRAGFAGRELSALWPDTGHWELSEHRAGWFSHLFIARRKNPFDGALLQPVVESVFGRETAEANEVPAEINASAVGAARPALRKEA